MSRLQQVQSDFQDYVLGDGEGESAIGAAITQGPGLDSGARLAIYHNAYRSRLREALSEAYERTWTYAGDELFAQLADGYLAAHPSEFRNLRWFGDRFAAHVAARLPDYPFVAELAAFEWALGLAFDAPDAEPLDQAAMASVPPEQWAALVLHPHPSLQLLEMRYNSVALWQALGDETEPPEAVESAEPAYWAVWRRDNQPHFRSLDAFEAQALRAVARGDTFGQLCERAEGEDAMPRMAGCLQNWLGQAMLTGPGARLPIPL